MSAIDRGQVNTEMIELITIGRKKVALKTKKLAKGKESKKISNGKILQQLAVIIVVLSEV